MQKEIHPNLHKELINLNKNIKNDYKLEAQCYDYEIFQQYFEAIENIINDWNYKLVSMQIKKIIGDTENQFLKQMDEINVTNSLIGLVEKISSLKQKFLNELRLEILKYNLCLFDGNNIDSMLNVKFLFSLFYLIKIGNKHEIRKL